MSDSAEEPKLIIDEDWKTQVQREKEELKQKSKSESQAQETGASAASDKKPTPDSATEQRPEPPPPASLTLLITTLATQAMAAMGLLPSGEGDEPPEVNLDFAKHFVDTLAVLEEKTRGNLDDDEKKYLDDALFQLRMTFVAVKKQHST